ncbi:hypothetical protein [Flagellimonas pacifica]|uniref:Uncharacterized protein n=1 Tax=Flagellimonas pacifica TaxID=1247520 RepID=A0A285MY88_9FLAO|nr:hypothetical protein [Allomuricauda parva]SNZ01643.1 hypothetical protein SAMN06265377_3485 [Allomuricauda parva]
MKTIKKVMTVAIVLSLSLVIYAQDMAKSKLDLKSDIEYSENTKNAEIESNVAMGPFRMTWCGTGPSGQIEAGAQFGSPPYTWTIPSNWSMQSTFGGFVNITTDCSSGTITVTDSNGASLSALVPAGCSDHGCGDGS